MQRKIIKVWEASNKLTGTVTMKWTWETKLLTERSQVKIRIMHPETKTHDRQKSIIHSWLSIEKKSGYWQFLDNGPHWVNCQNKITLGPIFLLYFEYFYTDRN